MNDVPMNDDLNRHNLSLPKLVKTSESQSLGRRPSRTVSQHYEPEILMVFTVSDLHKLPNSSEPRVLQHKPAAPNPESAEDKSESCGG